MVGYHSESIWNLSMISILLGLLFAVLSACLPGIFYYMRHPKDRKNAIKYAVMGGIGSAIFVTWIMAIAGAVKDCPTEEQRKKCCLSHGVWAVYGIFVLGCGIYFLTLLPSQYLTFQNIYRIGYFLAAGVLLLLPFTSQGKRFWACNLAIPYLLVCSANYTYTSMGMFFTILKLVLFAGAVFVSEELLRSAASKAENQTDSSYSMPKSPTFVNKAAQSTHQTTPASPQSVRQATPASSQSVRQAAPASSQSVRQTASASPSGGRSPAKKIILCTGGQYSGCQFPIQNGETLCLGSGPALAHLVFTAGGIAPLHLEITFQADRNQYLAAVPPGSRVYMRNSALPEISVVPIGEEISFGSPAQRFRLL